MVWSVEYTNEFGDWWETPAASEREDVSAVVDLSGEQGPGLPYPQCSGIKGSRRGHMRELRVQGGGKPIRVFHAFDPRRTAVPLVGGDKTGDDLFHRRFVPLADRLYDVHLEELREEGAI